MAGVIPLIALIGATASGKSAVALELAQRLGGELLSVDSMQVYRGMDIGTAKPSRSEQALVRHHMIDLVEPTETFTVSRFVQQADAIIADASTRAVRLIAAGGTPLYYKSLFHGLFDGPAADSALRRRLTELGNDALYARLSEVDPAAAVRIHRNDTKRLIRALEVYELTGQPISALQTDWASPSVRHEARWFGLYWDKDQLNRRINARVRQMMADGWLEEARALLQHSGQLSQTAAMATGYHELFEHIAGRISFDEAVEQIKIATRQLAKRQIKWFRRFEQVTWLDGSDSAPALAEQIVHCLASG
ncbi:MAG: tRNA (adenosine(37)-N6)-dimethylallyltransferase MiaA [Phycisphaerales bacterium]|nr:tRNA (adenosine(37)-N6)-dimethylallyltransferase MiaA [Phycisphaerales bacterium]